ncbi:MAG TPA: DUF2007 domain-containing protein [Phycisphaerales bacterium]|nr:DUF2007 domain-containing protein [Phycisphaerales bacterium]HRQ75403.1 DUF2007 domain-containing protein [Phycisphaerales bacterium]
MNPPQEQNRLVTLLKARSEFEANILVAQLEDEGIEAFAFSAVHGALPFGSKAFQIPVQVRESDLAAAKQFLRERATRSETLDWEDVEVGEREDELPLRTPGRMSGSAKAAFIIACALLALGVIGAIMVIVR